MGKGARRDLFGNLPDGRPVERVTLASGTGFEVTIITYGASLQSLMVPDYEGRLADVVLGHDRLAFYLDQRNFFGATIGRFSNRIADGRFMLDGVAHAVPVNDPPNALHGGAEGFDRRLWRIDGLGEGDAPFVTLGLESPDGDQGFPGRVSAHATFALTGEGELSVTMEATTDRPTVIGMTSHGYFNLAGAGAGSILGHRLQIAATHYLPLNAARIPEGSPARVDETPFDFRQPKAIGRDIRGDHPQILRAGGYDHCFCLAEGESGPRPAACVVDPVSGRAMDLFTDQPGLQFDSGNSLSGRIPGKNGRLYRRGDGFCLEPQAWPDAPNRTDFPSARLDPGERYRHRSIYRFRAEAPAPGIPAAS